MHSGRIALVFALLGSSPCFADAPTGADPTWLSSVEKGIRDSEYHVTWRDESAIPGFGPSWQAPNRAQGFRSWFAEDGVRLVPRLEKAPSWEWGLSLRAWGRQGAMRPVEPGQLSVWGNRVEIDRPDLLEWFVNDPRGLEHGFTVESSPESLAGAPDGRDACRPPLRIELATGGTVRATLSEDRQAVDLLSSTGVRVLRYAQLRVEDAQGTPLPAWFEGFVEDGIQGLVIAVDDAGAAYPLSIDPLATSPSWSVAGDRFEDGCGFHLAAAGDVNGDGFGDVLIDQGYHDPENDSWKIDLFLGSPSGLTNAPAWTLVGEFLSSLHSFATAGDVNCDGFSDFLVGSANDPWYQGRARLFCGGPDGPTLCWDEDGLYPSGAFGKHVAAAGDLNGDGCGDIAISEPHIDYPAYGRVNVWYGSRDGLSEWSGPDVELWGETGGGYGFGEGVGTAGDVNGDGYSDLAVVGRGPKVQVWHGSAAGISEEASWSIALDDSVDEWVLTAGDTDGDGYSDLVIGTPYDGIGEARVYAGSTSGLLHVPLWTVASEQSGAGYGESAGTAGDVNGDGFGDIVVSAPGWDTVEGADAGKVYVYLGSPAGPSDTPDWTIDGAHPGDMFGRSAQTAGDVNGDGYSDLIVSAPWEDSPIVDAGRVVVYHGGPGGLDTEERFTDQGDQAGAYFGYSVSSAGDVNGDGYGDVIVGAVLYDDGQTNEGKVFVYHGDGDGPDVAPDWTATSSVAEARLGWVVSSAGDVNGDGYSDVIVGARGYASGETDEGAAFVWHGSEEGLGVAGTPSNADWSAQANQATAYFGYSVSSAGDVNGDGYGDVIVGAPFYDDGQTDEGEAFVWFGSASGLGAAGTPANADWRAQSDQAGARFGAAVSTAGDVNSDGIDDVIVGAYAYDSSQSNEGGVFAWYGSLAGMGGWGRPNNADWSAASGQAGAYFGHAVAAAGDVNRDGYSDVIVGSYLWDTAAHADAGLARVWLGSSNGLRSSFGWSKEGGQAAEWFGYSVTSAGDVDADGYADIVVGAPQYDFLATDRGRAALFPGGATGPATAYSWQRMGPGNGDAFGQDVSGAGDVDGDGYADVIVGSPDLSDPEVGEGAAFLYLGNEGRARTVLPMQWRMDTDAPIAHGGLSDRIDRFRVTAWGHGLLGRGDVKLEWEVKRTGEPFDGTGLLRSSIWADSGVFHADLERTLYVNGGLHHWRVRLVQRATTSPFQLRSRWLTQPWGGWNEGDVRTIRDSDLDGHRDEYDNCPLAGNSEQEDQDGDGTGDACDTCTDTDADGFGNPGYPANVCAADNCPLVANASQADFDGDAAGDACDECTDGDGDGFGNPGFPLNTCAADNCPDDANPDQADDDADQTGEVCDNCPLLANASQADLDGDAVGDACDACTDGDGDGLGNPGFPASSCAIDCAPDDAGAWSVPSDPRNLTVTNDANNNLIWEAPESPGATLVRYDVLATERADTWNSGLVDCIEPDGTDLVATASVIPPRGRARFYLVRAENICGWNMGSDSSGAARHGRPCP